MGNTNCVNITCMTRTGDDYSVLVPCSWELCPDCQGSGTELYGSLKGYAFTASELSEWSPEDYEDYFGGAYDVPCSRCKGRTTIARPNLTGQPFGVKRDYLTYEHYLRDKAQERANRRYYAERGMEY